MKLNISKNTLISAEQDADERELIVPDGVKAIADEGLAHLPLIEKIVLPNSVRVIGMRALFGDINLRELTLPITASLKNGLLMAEFNEDIRLEKLILTVPKGRGDTPIAKTFVKRLLDMPSPRHVVFGPGLEHIAGRQIPYFFKETQSLEFSKGLKEIGIDNFNGMRNLTCLVFPGTLENLGGDSFNNCLNLHELTLPKNCKVGMGCFKACGTMRDGKKLAAPEFSVIRYQPSAEEIEPETPVETLILPGVEMKARGDRLFSTSAEDSVQEIIVPKGIRIIEAEGLAHLPCVKSILLPDSVMEIRARAFADNPRLTELAIPVSAKLDSDAFCGIRSEEEDRLNCLTLTVPKGKRIKQLRSKNTHAIFAPFKRIVFQPGIETIADYGAPNLFSKVSTIEFGEGLRVIGRRNFECSFSIKEIIFPSTLESIDIGSFCFLHNLHEVHLPKNCDLKKGSFRNCGVMEDDHDLPTPRFEIIRD